MVQNEQDITTSVDFPPRNPEVERVIQPMIVELLRLYDLSSPVKLKDEGQDKSEMAREAFRVWWRLYDQLLGWAQNHVVGECILSAEGDLTANFEKQFSKNANERLHSQEAMGALFAQSDSAQDWDLLERVTAWSETFDVDACERDPAIAEWPEVRHAINQILQGDLGNSSFWRDDLRECFRMMEFGAVHPLIRLEVKGKWGQAFQVFQTQKKAVMRVFFLFGQGQLKKDALEEVAQGLNVNVETLTTWEKKIKKELAGANDLHCAKLAGKIGDQFKTKFPNEIENWEVYGEFGGKPNIEKADQLYWRLSRLDFDDLKNELREARNSAEK